MSTRTNPVARVRGFDGAPSAAALGLDADFANRAQPARHLSKPLMIGVGIGVLALIGVIVTVMVMSKPDAKPPLDAKAASSKKPILLLPPNVQKEMNMLGSSEGPVTAELDEAQALNTLSGSKGAAVVMIYAPWCGACKMTKPAYEEAARASTNVPLLMVDGMKARAVMDKYAVKAFPTILGVRADGKITPFQGPRGKDQLLAFAQSLKA